MPAWALAAMDIGACVRRSTASSDGRLVAFCVVPHRPVFTALAALGAVKAGGENFSGGFSWTALRSLPEGTEIFWKAPESNRQFVGAIEADRSLDDCVAVRVSKGPAKWKGMKWVFTESKFRECTFSVERLLQGASMIASEAAADFFEGWGVPNARTWLKTSGAEIRIVGSASSFRTSLTRWSLSAPDSGDSVAIFDLLAARDEQDKTQAKVRLCPIRKECRDDAPMVLLDGPLAFERLSDFQDSPVLVVLAREEISEEHRNYLIQSRGAHAGEIDETLASYIGRDIPSPIELVLVSMRGQSHD